jgi:putative transposase
VQGKKSFKYRIEASSQTIAQAEDWLFLCRQLYNCALEERTIAYKHSCHSISAFDQKKELPQIKQAFPEYKEIGSQVLQDVLERLDKAYQAFFRRVNNGDKPGFPRFKGKNRYDSFTLKQTGWRLDGKYLAIRNIGRFKLRLSRPIEGDIKTVTIRRASTGKWYVCFACDNIPAKPLPPTGKSVGIDVGLESFLTTSDGMKVGNPRFFKKSKDILTMRQQRLSRRTKGSHRRTKARVLVAKAHEKIHNQRRDFHFKLANQLLKYYDTVCIERMDAWDNTTPLNRSMRDVAWFGFFDVLRWKAEEAARTVIEVPAKDTSQLCSRCGARVPKDLSVRIHACPSCGLVIDRDVNAALNILRLGQSLQATPAHSLS